MKFVSKALLASVLVVSLSSCGLIYQPVKNQGVVVTQEQVAQIKNGLTHEQVAYLLGSPTGFTQLSADKWYYTSRVIDSRSSVTEKTFYVEFKDDKVVSFGYQE